MKRVTTDRLKSFLLIATLTGGPVAIATTSSASSDDPCYGIEIEIQSERSGTIKRHQQGENGAKILAAVIRKRHRLATVPPVALVNDRLSDVPTISYHRPIDFSCALAISKAAQGLANIPTGSFITPQAVDQSARINVGHITVWWPANYAKLIADHIEK